MVVRMENSDSVTSTLPLRYLIQRLPNTAWIGGQLFYLRRHAAGSLIWMSCCRQCGGDSHGTKSPWSPGLCVVIWGPWFLRWTQPLWEVLLWNRQKWVSLVRTATGTPLIVPLLIPLSGDIDPEWASPLFHFHCWNQRWCALACCPPQDCPRAVIRRVTSPGKPSLSPLALSFFPVNAFIYLFPRQKLMASFFCMQLTTKSLAPTLTSLVSFKAVPVAILASGSQPPKRHPWFQFAYLICSSSWPEQSFPEVGKLSLQGPESKYLRFCRSYIPRSCILLFSTF